MTLCHTEYRRGLPLLILLQIVAQVEYSSVCGADPRKTTRSGGFVQLQQGPKLLDQPSPVEDIWKSLSGWSVPRQFDLLCLSDVMALLRPFRGEYGDQ